MQTNKKLNNDLVLNHSTASSDVDVPTHVICDSCLEFRIIMFLGYEQ